MNRDIFEQLRILRESSLARKSWLERTRSKLKAYMVLHPVRPQAQLNGSRITLHRTVLYFRPFFRALPAVITVFVLVVGVISGVARSSMPGDFLYEWKRNVNEQIKLSLALSDVTRAQYTVDLVGERLSEITALSINPTVTPDVTTLARQNLEIQVRKAEEMINDLGNRDTQAALDTTVRLHAVLAANQKVLSHIESTAQESARSGIRQTVNTVAAAQVNAENKTTQLSSKTTTSISRSELKTRTDAALSKAVKAISDATLRIGASTVDGGLVEQAKAKLSTAQDRLNLARQLYGKSKYSDAYVESRNAFQFAIDAKAIADVAENASPEVKERIGQSTRETPSIAGIAPQSVAIGNRVTITGSGFAATGNRIKIGDGYVIDVSSPDTTTLTFNLPRDLTICSPAIKDCSINFLDLRVAVHVGKYSVKVSTDKGSSDEVSLNVVSGATLVPKITSVTPSALAIGNKVIITGSNFASTNTIIFGNGRITGLESKDGSVISFALPASISMACTDGEDCSPSMPIVAGSYALSVSNHFGTSSVTSVVVSPIKMSPEPAVDTSEQIGSSAEISPTATPIPPTPHIIAIEDSSAKVGETVTLTGNGFGHTNIKVKFGELIVSNLSSADGKSLTFEVPAFSSLLARTISGVYKISVIAGDATSNTVELQVAQ